MLPQSFVILREGDIMASSHILADDVVDALFDEDFGLSDEDDSEFEGGDDIHAFIGERVVPRADIMVRSVDEGCLYDTRLDSANEDDGDSFTSMPSDAKDIETSVVGDKGYNTEGNETMLDRESLVSNVGEN